jgi:hypothetical protein
LRDSCAFERGPGEICAHAAGAAKHIAASTNSELNSRKAEILSKWWRFSGLGKNVDTNVPRQNRHSAPLPSSSSAIIDESHGLKGAYQPIDFLEAGPKNR